MIYEITALCVAVMVGIFAGHAFGRRSGRDTEKMRVERIFDVSLRTMTSPTVFSVYECVVGRITTDKLRDEHKAYMHKKDQETP